MNKNITVLFVLIYLLAFLTADVYFGYQLLYKSIFPNDEYDLLFQCISVGGIGGILYCLRGTYLNFCVEKNWDNDWIIWYIVRPVVSLVSGGVSCLFLKAGLLVLEAEKETGASNLGFYALAFIAGLNVEKFIAKIEELAKATWGIDKSRSADK